MTRQGEDLSGRNFVGADLSDANLRDVDLSDADLTGADLSNSNLKNADLRAADLTGADLRGANLTDANLVHADLTDATLTGVNLGDAILERHDDPADDDDGTSLTSIVETVVVGAILVLAAALFAVGWSEFWIVFVLGFFAVLPVATKLAELYEARTDGQESDPAARGKETDALATVRDRYASGEIDEAEFERRVEGLLETESVSDAETFYRPSGSEDAELEPETE